MIKLNILNMNEFLKTVDRCGGAVNVICPDGTRHDISRSQAARQRLRDQYRENKDYLVLRLDIQNPKDYLSIMYYYIGEC